MTDSLQTASAIARRVRDEGGRAIIVGGWVRDRIMGRRCKDVDLEVYGVHADALRGLLREFGSVNTVGESFTVYKVADVDVALPRRESKIGRSTKPHAAATSPSMRSRGIP